MALKATIYKVELSVSDMDRHHYQTYPLTLALHPSETIERMMVRLVVFARYASNELEFTRGLSTDDEPDLWQKDYSGDIEHWISLGQLDDKRFKKALNRSKQVTIVGYHGNAFDIWWQQNQSKCWQFPQLCVTEIEPEVVDQLAQLAQRTMRIQVIIEDNTLWISDDNKNVEVTFQTRQEHQ